MTSIQEAEKWLYRGVQLYNAGDFLGAINSWDRTIEINPDFHYAWYNRGFALGNLERYEEAIASYERALKIKPDFHYAWLNRGAVLGKLERYEKAIASFKRALEIKPDYHEAWFNRGVALEHLERYEEAIASYDRALEIKPDLYETWYNQGVALEHLERYEEAIASYESALEIKPDDHEAWSNRGVALGNLERYEEEISSYDRALEIKPDDHEAWSNRGVALDKLERYEEALASYDRALEINPDDNVASWSNRGVALWNLERYEEAIASYDRALEIKPDLLYAWSNRGLALKNLERYEEAIASYDCALAIKPDFHQAWLKRGIAAGNSNGCFTIVALSLPPEMQNPALDQRGYEGELAHYEEGLKYCHQDTHPQGWGMLHHEIGWAHYFRGKRDIKPSKYWRKALASYNRALQTLTQDDFPELHLEVLQDLIKALLGVEETDEAEEMQRRGTDLLQRLLKDPKRSDFRKKQLALKFASFQQLTVDKALRSGKLSEAWELAEAGKNACLTWLLGAWGDEIPQCPYADFQQLLPPTTAAIYWHLSPAALTTFIIFPNRESPPQGFSVDNLSLRGGGANRHCRDPRDRTPEAISPTTQKRSSSIQGGDCFGGVNSIEHKLIPSDTPPRNDNITEKYWSPPGISSHQISILPPSPEETPFQDRPLAKLEKWVKDWNQQYSAYRKGSKPAVETTWGERSRTAPTWKENLPAKLEQLKDILNINDIVAQLQGSDIENLIFIPHRDLHRFPLHALFPEPYTITYLPSAQIGINLAEKAPTQTQTNPRSQSLAGNDSPEALPPVEPREAEPLSLGSQAEPRNQTLLKAPSQTKNLLSIECPDSQGYKSLPFAEIESAAITQLFPATSIAGKKATKAKVEEALEKPYRIFHFAGHGEYKFTKPSRSSLMLTGEEKLTVEEILQLELSHYQLICLAACETAVTGDETITAEYVGIVSAFVSRNVKYVLSTLWTVESEASALISIYFYRRLKKGDREPIALAKAQKWLRQVKVHQLRRYYRKIIAQLPEENSQRIYLETEELRLDNMESSHQPYAHPYYWAAFTLTGFNHNMRIVH